MRQTSDEHSAAVLGQIVYPLFVPLATIEREAQELARRAGIDCSQHSVPVPVEDILERHLGFHLEFGDLRSCGALGATYVGARTVVVDESLDPVEYPQKLGRYRFTIGHEIGHLTLHRRYLSGLSEASEEVESETTVGENMLDVQADYFAAFLLMPTQAIQQALSQTEGVLTGSDSGDRLVRAMARQFQVSRVAMAIRLRRLDRFRHGE